jgi:hypothetical protein
MRTVRLTMRQTWMVGGEGELDQGPPEDASMLVPAVVWNQVVALGETYGRFHAPTRELFPSQVARLAKAIRGALDAEADYQVPPRRHSAQTALHQLFDYFSSPPNRKALLAVLKFLEGGGTLEVSDGNAPEYAR